MNDAYERALWGDSATGWRLGKLAAESHPNMAMVDGVVGPFDVVEFAAAELCETHRAESAHGQMRTRWSREHGVRSSPVNAVYDVRWEGHALRVITASWKLGYETHSQSIVLASDADIA